MRNLLNRFKAAWSAFAYAGHSPSYAVIYDSAEGIDTNLEDRREEFYEVFFSPEEAREFFRLAFPKGELAEDGNDIAHNPRLVMILGPIDRYGGQEEVTSPGSDAVTYFPLHC